MAKQNSGVKKVGANDKPETQTTTKEKLKGRIDFPKKTAMYRDTEGNVVTAVNAENLLIAVPRTITDPKDRDKIVYAGFDTRKHLPLKKVDFASMATYLLYQGFIARERAQRLTKIAENKEATATRLLKYKDEATRKKAAKRDRMRKELAALEKQLADNGVEADDV